MSYNNLLESLKARGNFGHSGRPGKVGGSVAGKGGGMAAIKAKYGAEFDKAVTRARATIAENNLSGGMVMYDEAGKLRNIDTDTWLTGKLSNKYTKVATVYSKRIEDANGKTL